MFQTTFYHGLIKKYVTYFGSIFSNIYIERLDADTNQIALIKVPLSYAPKEKALTRLLGDPNIDRQAAVLLPRMSFEITTPGFQYDMSRKLQSINKWVRKHPDDPNKVKFQYNPVPYNIFFSLYIYSKAVEDGLRIVEQIVPYFTPDWTATLHIIPELDDKRDVPIEFTSGPTMSDVYEDNFIKRRMITWQLNFTMRAWFFGPTRIAPIIKFANTTVYASTQTSAVVNTESLSTSTQNEPAIRLITTPGYTGSGPTSNASLTIPWQEIYIDDDFGFVEERSTL